METRDEADLTDRAVAAFLCGHCDRAGIGPGCRTYDWLSQVALHGWDQTIWQHAMSHQEHDEIKENEEQECEEEEEEAQADEGGQPEGEWGEQDRALVRRVSKFFLAVLP